jgi:cellulose synthase/poly-beta-1,6-N-acetylglucosamine synthase-like glycosyltransferase
MKRNDWHIGVLIPARNEEELLPRCLRSVLRARAALPPDVTCDIVTVVDSSTDRTYELASNLVSHGRGVVVETQAGVVGAARSLAADIALQRYDGPPVRCWLANTDADCCVPEKWLLDQLALAQAGVGAVTGIVDVDDFREHDAGVAQRFRETYAIYPDGRHPHVHGANLGVRADAYLRAGGWRKLATAEDHDLWNRLKKAGCNCVSFARMSVMTSGRRVGRAPHGFAGALAAHNAVPA